MMDESAKLDAIAQRRYELREAFDNGYKRAKLEIADVLAEVSAFLDNYADVVDGDDGEPVPNRAMRLQQQVDNLAWSKNWDRDHAYGCD